MYGNCCNHINLNNNQIFSASISHFLPEEETIVNDLTWQQLYDLFFHHQQSNNLITTVDHHQNQNEHQTVENNNKKREEEEVKKLEIISKCSSRKKSSSSSLVSTTTTRTTTTTTRTTSSGKKKDRHSKINTAQGPRDRRMRLSLQVARKFFDLQDMLGFDKASKTVEWLLIQSSSSIKQVMGIITPSISSEDASGIDDNSTTTTTTQKNHDQHEQKINVKSKGKKGKQARNISAFHDRFARESRKIARERARKRTIEKKRLGGSSNCPRINSSSFHQLGLHPELTSPDHHQLLETVDYAPDPPLPHDHDSSLIWNSSAICTNFHQNSQISHGVCIYMYIYICMREREKGDNGREITGES